MNVKTLIAGNPSFTREYPIHDRYLEISEFFFDTIQGEGINIGQPAAFLRLQGCTQNCRWCDTREVWRFGNPYIFDELFSMIEAKIEGVSLLERLQYPNVQHLVLTGGSPLMQQDRLLAFLKEFIERYCFVPHIEIENECTIMPSKELIPYISTWNNSPKLSNSGNAKQLRFQPEIIIKLSKQENSWFKFVVSRPSDWEEIKQDFIDRRLIYKNQIILMPQGATREELKQNAPEIVKMAIREGVRYCTREHVVLWDRKTGV